MRRKKNAELFMECDGHNVYRAWKDAASDVVLSYTFSLDPKGEHDRFELRDCVTYAQAFMFPVSPKDLETDEGKKTVISMLLTPVILHSRSRFLEKRKNF